MYINKVSFSSPPHFMRLDDVIKNHQFVMSLFPDDLDSSTPRQSLNVLWRKEQSSRGEVYFLIQSDMPASLDFIKNEKLAQTTVIMAREIDNVYDSLFEQEEISYKIRVNPVAKKDGKRVAVRGQDNIHEWWIRQASQLGISLDPERTIVFPEEVAIGNSKDKKVLFNSASIVGKASISDLEKLKEVTQSGFGKGKGYGFGLLLLGS